MGRITDTQQPGNKETFAFDPAHNLIAKGDEAIKDNRLKVFEDKRYQYDTFGNMTEKKIGKHTQMAFSYDAEHQMKTVDISKNGIKQSYQYAYDPFGRRISKTDSFNTTHFIWDGNRLLSEARGSQTKTYVYEQDGFVPVAQLDEQGIQYYHTDHLGTPRELTNSEGEITWEATYQTWGNTLKVVYQPVEAEKKAATNADIENELAPAIQPLRFQGQYFDEETGLHYNRMRYFDPDVGRFVSQDPIGLLGGDNLYQYADNPTAWIDPLGLACTGRTGKQKRLKDLLNDPKVSKADKGWIRQEMNAIAKGSTNKKGNAKGHIRNPPGKELAHERGGEAAKGYGYEHSNLQDTDLHKLQHKHDDKGRKNKERPVIPDNECCCGI